MIHKPIVQYLSKAHCKHFDLVVSSGCKGECCAVKWVLWSLTQKCFDTHFLFSIWGPSVSDRPLLIAPIAAPTYRMS